MTSRGREGTVDSWQPLSVREGSRQLDGPYEGVPAHLQGALRLWLQDTLDATGRHDWRLSLIQDVIVRTRAPVTDHVNVESTVQSLLECCSQDDQLFLDVIDACLHFDRDRRYSGPQLSALLAEGGSAWTLAAGNKSLQRAVAPQTQAAFEQVTSPADAASSELSEAWSNVYGREPDPSDAWDLAIKAVEAIRIPIVVPKQNKPTLGHVVSHLASQGHLWKLLLPGPDDDYSVEPLVGMLRLLWPNPDRHGSPEHRRPPTLEEAQAVVHLAVTIVQWGRAGQIVRS